MEELCWNNIDEEFNTTIEFENDVERTLWRIELITLILLPRMRLRGRPVRTGDGWRLNVVCGYHNHDVAENLEGHAYVGRLNVDALSLLNDMTKNMVKPKNILLTLKDHDKDNVTTIKQIYNA
ncbi:hypothetical protein SESBI_11449 [Sesbania bispinosa]|nr:hypothetical protein SESBI_11449 [Sesbania bispinosa]